MIYDLDTVRERRGTDSAKWGKYGDEVLPLWVADMDFPAAEPILQALHQRVNHGFFGYARPTGELCRTICERLMRLYRWEVKEEEIFFLPCLVAGLNLSYLAFSGPGEGILAQPPVYHHFLKDPVVHDRLLMDPPLVPKGDTYEIDFEAFENAISSQTRMFILCNPQNPVGRVLTRTELENLGEICLRRNLVMISDEIHCDLLFPGQHHIPLATLDPEIAGRTVTLMAPSKTYNLAGLNCGFAIIQNPRLQKIWRKTSLGLIPSANIMGHTAALAGFRDGQEWLEQVLSYLKSNYDFLMGYFSEKLPAIRMTRMEGTYLAWLDCRKTGIPGNPFEFFLKEAKVALNDGEEFGKGGEGFVRLNFACPRKILEEALEKLRKALEKI
ncbi:MAG: putative aminotransferase [Deltaproteobacteria bacterium]|nr:putative aminotransferase [Deltaproteobacteria bacterium]